MLDLGWSELLVIGIVALIVVGPKDLPRMLRTLGQYAAKAKSVAREFQRSMDEAARQADIDELRQVKKDLDKDVRETREAQYKMQREMSQSFMDKPAKDKRAGDKPAGDKPAGDKPAGDKPAAKAKGPAEPQPAAEAGPAEKPRGDSPAPAGETEPRKATGA